MTSGEVVSLKEHVEVLVDAAEARLAIKIGSLEKAVGVASAELTIRLEGMNEIRKAMNDREEKLATKESVSALAKEVKELRETLQSQMSAQADKFFALIGGIDRQVQDLKESKADTLGRRAGYAPIVQVIVVVVAALLGALLMKLL